MDHKQEYSALAEQKEFTDTFAPLRAALAGDESVFFPEFPKGWREGQTKPKTPWGKRGMTYDEWCEAIGSPDWYKRLGWGDRTEDDILQE